MRLDPWTVSMLFPADFRPCAHHDVPVAVTGNGCRLALREIERRRQSAGEYLIRQNLVIR